MKNFLNELVGCKQMCSWVVFKRTKIFDILKDTIRVFHGHVVKIQSDDIHAFHMLSHLFDLK